MMVAKDDVTNLHTFIWTASRNDVTFWMMCHISRQVDVNYINIIETCLNNYYSTADLTYK